MTEPITAAMLYDLVACPHRVAMDLFTNPAERDVPNAFVQLLWEKGSAYEQEVISGLDVPFLDLSKYSGDEKELLTTQAMEQGEPLIYGGRISADNLLGAPDLLRNETQGYVAGDIKSGAGEEGAEGSSRPKLHYAVQLGLYTDILERRGLSAGRRGFIWDIHGDEVIYDFDELRGKRDPRTLWQDYQDALHQAEMVTRRKEETTPAYSAVCKFCHWYSACLTQLEANGDLTMIPELGRSKRDVLCRELPTVSALADASPDAFIEGKKTVFPGIGADTLLKYHDRAKLLTTQGAVAYSRAPLSLPDFECELFFDVEVDPMRDICYLHGFVERHGRDNATESFFYTFADEISTESEKAAFADALAYIDRCRPCAIFFYSKYERTIYRKLQEKYPDVSSAAAIEGLFDPAFAVDLYNDAVKKGTEWPTWDYSIKSLAKYLGFAWRDTHPSGAASIEWFNRWIETGDEAVRQRILDYNEDDCRATRVLRDALDELPVMDGVEHA